MARKQKATETAIVAEQQTEQVKKEGNLTLSNPAELTVKAREPKTVSDGKFTIINH